MTTDDKATAKELKVLVVRDGECWLASDPARRSHSGYYYASDDAQAIVNWLKEWGRKELGVEVREF